MEHETFENFCNRMHQNNISGRMRRGEPDISYNDYLKKNLNFLHHKYEGQKSEQKGKDMDGLNKYFGVHSL